MHTEEEDTDLFSATVKTRPAVSQLPKIFVAEQCVHCTPLQEEKDLGVIFDGKLSFDAHIQNCISKANRILGIIKRSFSYLDK